MKKQANRGDGLRSSVSRYALHVLLALEQGSLHGYAIMKEVQVASGASVGPGAIYGALQRLEAAGLVREAGQGVPDRGSRPRQRYEITEAGVETLKAEARSLARLVRLAAQRHLIVDEGLGQE